MKHIVPKLHARRWLIAHDAQEDQNEVDSMVAYVDYLGVATEIQTARGQRALLLSALGSEDALARELGGGYLLGGNPRFHAIACLRFRVGRRTAVLVETALKARRKVYYADGLKLIPVASITTVDEDDWQSGWQLEAGNLTEALQSP